MGCVLGIPFAAVSRGAPQLQSPEPEEEGRTIRQCGNSFTGSRFPDSTKREEYHPNGQKPPSARTPLKDTDKPKQGKEQWPNHGEEPSNRGNHYTRT